MRLSKVSVIILCCMFLSSCGYRIGSLLPPDLKTIAVPMFENRTPEPQLESLVTNAVIKEIIADGTLKVTDRENADLILSGQVIDYRREPLRFTKDVVTEEYRLIIAVKARLIDLRRNKVMWETDRIQGDTTFFVRTSLPASEQAALPKALRDLAHHIVEKIVEGGW